VPATWPRENFLRYLDDLMRHAGIRDFAELSRRTGVNPSQLSNWKNGVAQPSRANLTRVAKVLDAAPVRLWVAAGLATADELDLTGQVDLTVLPPEFRALVDFYNARGRTDEQRAQIRAHINVAVSGLRAMFGETDTAGATSRSRRAG
jgi:transcriptional regulator with XRE-family HTH domain